MTTRTVKKISTTPTPLSVKASLEDLKRKRKNAERNDQEESKVRVDLTDDDDFVSEIEEEE